jgi:hypothetical protein
MLKIVDIHVSGTATGEYVVLQNQGLTTVSLRGWALCTEAYLSGDPDAAAAAMLVMTEDVPIKPYTRVVLYTGAGDDGWYATVDGKRAYVTHWGRREPVWSRAGYIHLLQSAASRKVVLPQEAVVALRV